LILYISPASRPLTGHEPHELIGRAGIELIHPEDRAMVSEAYRDLFEHTGAITSPPYRMLRKDGTIVWIESTVRAVRDPVTGEAIELQASARDISARMRADLALERTNAELERSNAELERFAYDASHDLGQPLRVIENLMKRLTEEQGQGLGPAGRRLVASALEGVGRMQTLIQDLLEYAKVSSEPLARNTVDCSEIVDQILEVFAEAIAEKNGLISAGRLPSVTAHQAQIRQLFQNLLSNAIKFTRDAEPPRVAIDAERQDGEWKFSVVDNGIGIEERDAERIFEMFRRLHAPDAYAGNGMGLSICKRIVERHGGRIWAGPAGGGGSALFFTLPDVKV
jgi:PAS domain S-box-containing protein